MRKTLFALFVIAFITFAAAWMYVQSDGFAARIRPFIVERIQSAIGKDAKIGRIKANLFPLSLEIRDTIVPSARSIDSIAIRKVKIYLNPFPLLWKTVSIPSLMVLEPKIHAVRSASGSVDVVELLRTVLANLAQSDAAAPSVYPVRLRTVSIRNGSVQLIDDSTGAKLEIKRLSLRVRLDLPRERADFRISKSIIAFAAPAYPEFAATMRTIATYDHGSLSLTSFELASERGQIEASGVIGLLEKTPVRVSVNVRMGKPSAPSISKLLRLRQKHPLLDAELLVTGTVTDPVVEGRSRFYGIPFAGITITEGNLSLTYRSGTGTVSGNHWTLARGDRNTTIDAIELRAGYREKQLEIVHAAINAAHVGVTANGLISAREGYQLTVASEVTGSPEFLQLLTDIPMTGTVAVRGILSGAITQPRFEGTFTAGTLTVRGVPFQSVSGQLGYRDKQLSVTAASIQHASSRYLFDGSVSFQKPEPWYEARLKVFKSDVVSIVALFYERIPLQLDASGELIFAGTSQEFMGSGNLDLKRGTAYGETFDRGSVIVELTSRRVSFPRVSLEKEGTVLSGSGWIGFDGTYAAAIDGQGADLSRVDRIKPLPLSGPFTIAVRSSGSFAAPVVKAQVSSGALSYRNAVVGTTACTLEIADRVLTVSALVQDKGDNRLSGRGTMKLQRPYPWSAVLEILAQDIDLASFAISNELAVRTKLSLKGTLKVGGSGLDPSRTSGSLFLHRVSLSLGEYQVENEGAIDLGIDNERITVRSMTFSGPETKLTAAGSSGFGSDLAVTLTGEVNLSLLRGLSRAIEHADGSALLKITLRGNWASPDMTGEVVLSNGLIKIRDIPQRFTRLNGTVSFDRSRIVSEGISGDIGGGTLSASGSAQFQGTVLEEFSTKAVIENVTVRYPPGLEALLGGILYYDGNRSSQILSGEVKISRARYERRVPWKSMLVDFSKKFMPQKKTELGWIGETQLNVRFIGKENIVFESNLAKVPLEIDMLFRGTVSQAQVLGRVEAQKGEVYFRNNVFRILRASADFADPNRINPLLDVQAETRVREYQIRLGVTGNADRAVVTFLADPPLSDSDILALLAIGRRGEELKGKEADVGRSEAAAFATGMFQDFLESRARSITGLDRFQVDPYINKYDIAVPRVTVGKEVVQDRVFMSYSSNIGGTIPEQNIRLEYILNRNVSVLGEYDELGQLGADIKFRFEFR